jgi:CO/xanthine dehydrogenase Mo-binding subunit
MASAVPALVLKPAHLEKYPLIRDWIEFRDGRVLLKSGKVELGQGIHGALSIIAAEELQIDVHRIANMRVSTQVSPDEDYTAGSLSVTQSGAAIRSACAAARSLLLKAVETQTGSSASALVIEDGRVLIGSQTFSYWHSLPAESLAQRIDSIELLEPARRAEYPDDARQDLGLLIRGRRPFVQDLKLPGMLFGRVVRPPPPLRKLESLNDGRARALPGVVAIVREGNFLGVVAEREEIAVRAAERLAADCVWASGELTPPTDFDWLEAHAGPDDVVVKLGETPALGESISATYTKPWIAHASIGPSAAVAKFSDDGSLEVWSHTQGPFPLRRELGLILKLPLDRITVHHAEGSGCYGHNGAEDAALDAVLMAHAVTGRPVKVQWSRADEFAHEPYSSAMKVKLSATLDAEGRVAAWRHDLWSNGHNGRPGYAASPVLLAAAQLESPFELAAASDPPMPAGGAQRNSVPLYDFPAVQVVRHPVLKAPLRVSALRALGAYANIFAIESFMDELALAAHADPVEFRLRHLKDPRARAVIEAAAAHADWPTRASSGAGIGIGFAQYKNSSAYCAVIAEIDDSSPLGVSRLIVVADAGRIVSKDGVRNQLEGGAIQAASWTLKEAVRTSNGLPPLDWESYPILRFSEAPKIETILIDRPDQPSLGVGECVAGPVAAAIANAFFNAYELRFRDLPINRERVLAALQG